MEIIDNFLPPEDFKKISETCINTSFPLYYSNAIVDVEDDAENYFFIHTFYKDEQKLSDYYYVLEEHLFNHLALDKLIRCKLNVYPKSNTIKNHGLHTDYNYNHKGLILSLNSCNGGTSFEDGTFVEAVQNRALFHDPSIKHSSTTHTNSQCRFNIVVNWQ